MSIVNPGLVQFAPIKDSRWLTLEVCREYQRNRCTRSENECKFAHPPAHLEVQNGRVVCCYDSIKGKCQRKEPPCKYLHPPQHLRDQLVQNGRNNLIVKNLQMQIMSHNLLNGQLIPFTGPLINGSLAASSVSSGPAAYASYLSAGGLPVMATADALIGGPQTLQNGANGAGGGHSGQGVKLDSRECMPGSAGIPTSYTSLPGGKRSAVADNKSGIPVYQPTPAAPTYQQLAAFQVPSAQTHATGAFIPTSFAGHVAAVPRY